MSLFHLLMKHFWLLCVAVAGANYLLSLRRGSTEADPEVDPQLRRKVFGWFWGLSILPWLVMGFGQLVGGVPSVLAFFRPQDRDPYVWGFYASILLVYLIAVYWVLFRDGARIAAQVRLLTFHGPGFSGALSESWIKVLAVAMLPFLVLWLWLVSQIDVRLP